MRFRPPPEVKPEPIEVLPLGTPTQSRPARVPADPARETPGGPDEELDIQPRVKPLPFLRSGAGKGADTAIEPAEENDPEREAAEREPVPAYEQSLLDRFNDPDPATRRDAATQLGELTMPHPAVVKGLGSALDDVDQQVRKAAALAVGRIGTDARDAVPALISAYKSDSGSRLEVVQALATVGRGSPRAIDLLARAVQPGSKKDWMTSDVEVRRAACRALGVLGPAARSAVPALIALVRASASDLDKAAQLYADACDALGKIGDPRAMGVLKTHRTGTGLRGAKPEVERATIAADSAMRMLNRAKSEAE